MKHALSSVCRNCSAGAGIQTEGRNLPVRIAAGVTEMTEVNLGGTGV